MVVAPVSIDDVEMQFNDIKAKYDKIVSSLATLNEKHETLSALYKQFVEQHMQNVTTLDIFNFQNKIFSNEIIHIKSKFELVCNRLYCLFYKQYIVVSKFMTSTCNIDIESLGINNDIQEYDDMRPEKTYEFADLIKIHANLCKMHKALMKFITCSNDMMQTYKTIKDTGIFIDVLVDTLDHKNKSLHTSYNLYLNNMVFFNKCASQYFIQLMDDIDDTNKYTTSYVAYDALQELTKATTTCQISHDMRLIEASRTRTNASTNASTIASAKTTTVEVHTVDTS